MKHDKASSDLNYNNFEQSAIVVDPGATYVPLYDLSDAIYDTLVVQNGTDQNIFLEFTDKDTPATKKEMVFLLGTSLAIPINHSGPIRIKAALAATGTVLVTSV